MLTEDYFLRQIAQAATVLAKVLGLSKSGKYQEASLMINQAIEDLVGLNANIVKQMNDFGLISILMSGQGFDCGKAYVLAELFKMDGDVLADQGQKGESQESYQRALMLYYEYTNQCADKLTKEIQKKIDELEKDILEHGKG